MIKKVINKNRKQKFIPIPFCINRTDTKDAKIISNGFNEYFVNVGRMLDNKIPPSMRNPMSYLKKRYEKILFLTPCVNSEIGKIINSFDPNN